MTCSITCLYPKFVMLETFNVPSGCERNPDSYLEYLKFHLETCNGTCHWTHLLFWKMTKSPAGQVSKWERQDVASHLVYFYPSPTQNLLCVWEGGVQGGISSALRSFFLHLDGVEAVHPPLLLSLDPPRRNSRHLITLDSLSLFSPPSLFLPSLLDLVSGGKVVACCQILPVQIVGSSRLDELRLSRERSTYCVLAENFWC